MNLLCSILLAMLALSIREANALDQSWCVAKANAADAKLKQFIREACSPNLGSLALDCSKILAGGACFEPNTVRDHASYVLNLFYNSRGECKADIGVIVKKDPSTKSCSYVGSP